MEVIKTKYKITIGLLAIINILRSACLIAVTLTTRSLINVATSGDELQWPKLLQFCIILISLVAIQILLRVGYQLIFNKYSLRYELDLKEQIYSKFIDKNLTDIQNIHSGEMSNIFLNDVRNIADGYFKLIPSFVLNASTFIFAFVTLLIIDFKFLLMALAFGLIVYLLSLLYGKHIKKLQKKVLESNGKLTAYMQESMENAKLLKANAVEDNAKELLKTKTSANYKIRHKYYNLAIIGSTGMMSIFNFTYVFTLIYGAYMLFKMPQVFSYGTLVALLRLVNHFESPISSMSELLNRYFAFKVSKQRVKEIDDLPDELEGEAITDFDAIVFHNVSFSYDKLVIKNLSLEIKKNEIWSFKGPSGIGKTTLLNLLLGFIKPQSGKISIKLKNKFYAVSKATRKLFAYVPQENILFSGTIRDNINLFAPNSSEENIEKCLKLAMIYQDIDSMPLKLDTRLGERGVGLSLGQIQRILIAISLLKDRPILLLDEFTSALDKQVESKIISNLTQINKTIILITHRDIKLDKIKELTIAGEEND